MAAGLITTVVGFTSSFAVVLTGLHRVGADDRQAGSGLLVLCLTMGLGSLLFSVRYRMPITMAWSTPGAALLAGASVPAGGFGTAVTAFGVTGILLALCGLVRPLGRAVTAIPPALASAMLAGVLLQLCVAPFQAAGTDPARILPVIAGWLLLLRFARRWAVPGALAIAVVVMAVSGTFSRVGGSLAPALVLTAPTDRWGAALSLAVPLFLVTMTSQNVPGVAVLASFGYRVPLAPALAYTGAATAVGAAAGGHAVNLAAISAALAAGPSASPDPGRRWIAGATSGAAYLAVGPLAAVVAAVAAAAPAGVIPAMAGLALVGTFAAAGAAALADEQHREAAAVAFLVAASGIHPAGIGAAFWALLAGALTLLITDRWRRPGRSGPGEPGP